MKFSIIIAYKADHGIRTQHMLWTVARYQCMFPDAEIIISQSPDDTGGWSNFCKGRWINAGVRKATNRILLITDIDVILSKVNIIESIKRAKQHCLIVPYDTLYKLTNGTSKRILSRRGDASMPKVALAQQKKVVLGDMHPQGISIIMKENFERAGGYDERFIGWGSEDSAFQTAVATMCRGALLQLPGYAYHLKHPVVHNRQVLRDHRVGDILAEYKSARGDKEKMSDILKKRGVII